LSCGGIGDEVQVKPPPLLMVGVDAFMLALLVFGVALIAPFGPPPWLWSLNAAGIAYCVCSAAYWCRQANR